MISCKIVLTDFALISVSLIDCQICDGTYEWKFRQEPVLRWVLLLVFGTVICLGTFFESGVNFACFKHGGFFVLILQFLMGWGPCFFRFFGFVDFGLFLEYLDFSVNTIK